MNLNTTDVLPSELWGPIFRAACTDGGTTGRSLALVSKRLRYLSEPYQLQSIAINNLDDAIGFISRLEASSALARSGVRSLYFSNSMMSTASLYEDKRRPSQSSAKRNVIRSMIDFVSDEWVIIKDERWWKLKLDEEQRRTRVRRRRISQQIRWQIDHIVPAFYTILYMISPYLRSLTVDLTGRTTIPYARGNFVLPALPVLTSFAIRDNSTFKSIIHSCYLIRRPSALSSITYLDLVNLRHADGWSEMVTNVLKEIGPSLRYVRVNMDGHMTGDENIDANRILKVKLPGSLRIVFLQLLVCSLPLRYSAVGCWKKLVAEDYRFVILFPVDEGTSIEDLVTRHDL